MQYKAVIFDLGGVLFSDGTRQFVEYLHDNYGVERSDANEVLAGDFGSAYRVGRMSRDEFWDRAIKFWEIDADTDTLEQQWISGYHLDEQVKELILALKKSYDVYYLSDNVKERVEVKDAEHNFIRMFTGGIFSHDVGVRKPNPEIYRLIVERTGYEPSELVFIDDKVSALEPAADMGITTIHFTGAGEVRQELVKLGLL